MPIEGEPLQEEYIILLLLKSIEKGESGEERERVGDSGKKGREWGIVGKKGRESGT